ncbi:MAG: hypothetical protein ACJARL_001304 [Halopseudomonas sp.]|jgi:hypothetical protein
MRRNAFGKSGSREHTMSRLTSYLWITIFLAQPAVANERSFIYTNDWERARTLMSICTTEKFEHDGKLLFRAVSMETKKMVRASAKEIGFSGGSCGNPTRENYDEMGVMLFTMGAAVLHLTADEIEEFRKVNEETGRIEDFNVSDSWPPND